MLLWCVSTFLILSFSFPDTPIKDLEIDNCGTIWLLPVSDPGVIRLDSLGNRQSFETGYAGLPSGLAVSPSGRWVVCFQNPGILLEYDEDDILIDEVSMQSVGDVLLPGLRIWAVDTARGNVVYPGGEIIARNCAGSFSRLCRGPSGSGMVSGSEGVFIVEPGELPVRIAGSGSACYSSRGILILDSGVLCVYQGDTLSTDIPYSSISASPDGEIVVLWGGETPLVLE
ncbi:MAG: hypothetical protein J7K88_00155 [Candidatus Fermentibacteraceae bacterium]|nr:hypothetical protein [Candidatus Fermentibacteraceae bacterium]